MLKDTHEHGEHQELSHGVGELGGGRTACGVWTVRSVSENALMMGKIVKTIRVIVLSNSPFQQHPKPLFSNIPIYT